MKAAADDSDEEKRLEKHGALFFRDAIRERERERDQGMYGYATAVSVTQMTSFSSRADAAREEEEKSCAQRGARYRENRHACVGIPARAMSDGAHLPSTERPGASVRVNQ